MPGSSARRIDHLLDVKRLTAPPPPPAAPWRIVGAEQPAVGLPAEGLILPGDRVPAEAPAVAVDVEGVAVALPGDVVDHPRLDLIGGGEAKNVARLRSLVNEDSEPLTMRAP